MNQRAQILAAVKLILMLIVERKADSIPMMFRGVLAKFSPESLEAMIQDNLSEADWLEIEKIFVEE